MFETITEKSHKYLDQHIQELTDTCNNYPDIKEFVRYIIAYSDEMAYSGGSQDARIGRELIQFIWQITSSDLSAMGNQFHFSPDWARELNGFIGGVLLDDLGFNFTQGNRGVFSFTVAGDEADRYLQDPRILVEAAKANCAYHERVGLRKLSIKQLLENIENPDVKVDDSKVFELLRNK